MAAGMAEVQPGGPLGWYAIALVGQPQRDHIPVYGIKPPSRQKIEIPPGEFNTGGISDDGKSLKRWAEDTPRYIDLEIKRADMKKQIKEIKSWG